MKNSIKRRSIKNAWEFHFFMLAMILGLPFADASPTKFALLGDLLDKASFVGKTKSGLKCSIDQRITYGYLRIVYRGTYVEQYTTHLEQPVKLPGKISINRQDIRDPLNDLILTFSEDGLLLSAKRSPTFSRSETCFF